MLTDIKSLDLQILSKSQLLSRLEPPEVKELLSLAVIEQFAAHSVIFNKGDPGDRFYAILEGQVGISTVSQEGKEIFLNILDQGEVFGEIAVLDDKDRTASAVAMEPTLLLKIGRAEFLPFLESHPRLCIRLMAVLCDRLRWTSGIIEDTIFLDIPRRLAKRLLTLAQRHGEAVDSGTRLPIKLSQEDLGHMLGATRESVNKGIRWLQKIDAISYLDGYIIVKDMTLLESLIGEEQIAN
jgi:CRP-like cAMP-binding protein